MAKNLEICVLFDFYGDMLTDKQRDLIDLYYNQDLSLGEIAEIENITRQGVRDSIKRGEAYLLELEQKLGLLQRYKKLNESLDKMKEIADDVANLGQKYRSLNLIDCANNIIKVRDEIANI